MCTNCKEECTNCSRIAGPLIYSFQTRCIIFAYACGLFSRPGKDSNPDRTDNPDDDHPLIEQVIFIPRYYAFVYAYR